MYPPLDVAATGGRSGIRFAFMLVNHPQRSTIWKWKP